MLKMKIAAMSASPREAEMQPLYRIVFDIEIMSMITYTVITNRVIIILFTQFNHIPSSTHRRINGP